ncbi:MAG: hypothetical protein ACI978_002695 [Oleispira sp.]|jgi:hypothetical protein
MYRLSTTILLMILSTLALADQQKSNEGMQLKKFTGYAYDMKTQEFLYTEHHNYLDTFLHVVEYKEADGELFASKSINYNHSFFAPDIKQTNLRNGEVIDIKRKNKADKGTKNEQAIQYLVQYKENTKESLEKETIEYSPRLIIDAGFDHFVTHNWQTLSAGKEISIDYLIPSAQDYYELTIKQETCKLNPKLSPKLNGQVKAQFEDRYCFSIAASSFFIGLFSSQLELTYSKNKDSGEIRLMGFQGRSNISDSKGNYQDVNIVYQY